MRQGGVSFREIGNAWNKNNTTQALRSISVIDSSSASKFVELWPNTPPPTGPPSVHRTQTKCATLVLGIIMYHSIVDCPKL